ncbi:MAG TPA: asparaginase [Gammaproteobacteria bacterium]|nr:asparaginase [Gammaproteobacteria bacterium]
MQNNPLLIEITRGNVAESAHRGAFMVANDQNELVASGGDIDHPIYPRSAVKPLQALPLIESGAADRWRLSDCELALACASHNAEPRHTDSVLAWLKKAGLSERDLACGPQAPISEGARDQLLLQNVCPGRVHHNCSGKHAGFLSTAAHLGEPSVGYLELEHPVQQRVKKVLAEITDNALNEATVGVDGCGAPVFGMSLRGLALAMARYGTGTGVSGPRAQAAARFYRAMVREPYMVAGTGRWCTRAMQITGERLAVKGGAEGVYCAIVPGQRIGIALKIDDGGSRAAEALMGLLLIRYAGLGSDQSAKLEKLSLPAILNAEGKEVGATRPAGAV